MKYWSRLLYIPVDLIEIHHEMKYQLQPLTGLEILPWTNILTLIIGGFVLFLCSSIEVNVEFNCLF